MPEIVNSHPSIPKLIVTLPEILQSKIRSGFKTIERYGKEIGFPDARKLSSNLYEFRITGEIHVRIFYTVIDDTAYILHLFVKKSRKLPHKELDIAQKRLQHILACR